MKIELNDKLKTKLNQLIQNKKEVEIQINDLIITVLDAKEIDYTNKNVTLNNDLSIQVEEK